MYNGEETYPEHSRSLQQAAQVVGVPRPPSDRVQDPPVQDDSANVKEAVVLPQDPQREALNLGQVQHVEREQGVFIIDGAINDRVNVGSFRNRL